MAGYRPTPSKSQEVINHFGAVRLRVNGYANLQLTLLSLDEIQNNILAPIPLQTATNIEPNRLSNFTQQRAKLMIQTINSGEYFVISRIVIFTKPVAMSWPETI
jgi:hypothetical protein